MTHLLILAVAAMAAVTITAIVCIRWGFILGTHAQTGKRPDLTSPAEQRRLARQNLAEVEQQIREAKQRVEQQRRGAPAPVGATPMPPDGMPDLSGEEDE